MNTLLIVFGFSLAAGIALGALYILFTGVADMIQDVFDGEWGTAIGRLSLLLMICGIFGIAVVLILSCLPTN